MKDRFLSEMWYFYNLFLFETTRAEEYFIQHYVITFVIDLRKVGCALWVLQFSQTNQTNRHDIIQLSPFLECDPTVCLPEKSKVTQLFEGRQTSGHPLFIIDDQNVSKFFLFFPLFLKLQVTDYIEYVCIRHQVIEYLRFCKNIR
jgi:hypothetical protein